jgi:purine-nucleoside phosphorylase
MGMKVLGFSVITDMGLPDSLEAVSLEDVLASAAKAQPNLTKLIEKVLDRI